MLIIARVVISGGGAYRYGNEGARHWDIIPFADGGGFIVRPHPYAGGGAHPRYLEQGNGFLSISPAWKAASVDNVLKNGKIVALDPRETRKLEKFFAVLPTEETQPTHLLILADWTPNNADLAYIFKGEDRTASGKDSAVETAFLLSIGQEVWNDNIALKATAEGLEEGRAEGISEDDNLG